MAITVDFTSEELEELMSLTKQRDPAAALRLAVQEYIRYAQRKELKELSGHIEMQDNWRELERAELEEMESDSGEDNAP